MSEKTTPYQIVATEIISFEIQPSTDISITPNYLLDYDIEQEQKLDAKKRLLLFTVSVKIRAKKTGELMITMQCMLVFKISNFEDIVSLKELNQFSLLHEINISINRVSIGVTRGLLAGKLKETFLSGAILPLLPIEY